MSLIKLRCIIEIEAADEGEARRKLDAFREAVRLSSEYGITMVEDNEEVDCCLVCSAEFTHKDIDGGRCFSCGSVILYTIAGCQEFEALKAELEASRRTVKRSDVRYVVEIFPEDQPVSGNVLQSGDEKADLEAEEWVNNQLRNGNEMAWCGIQVTAKVVIVQDSIYTGSDFLGGCSYENMEEFKKDAYYSDMKDTALANLVRRMMNQGLIVDVVD